MSLTPALRPGVRLPEARISITQSMIDGYAAISGDYNPLHVDVAVAAASDFGGTIAHGCIPMEPIFHSLAEVLGRPDLPYGTAISLRYKKPSRPADTIHVRAEVVGEEASGGWRIGFACLNQHGETVIEGECLLPQDGRG